jgi:photosystem II stability/assembly factor-like uncharacterized protein
MVETRQVDAGAGDVVLMVGTTKGAFLFRSGRARREWSLGGPFFPGQEVYAIGLDQRAGRRRLWAGPNSGWYGPALKSSDDLGRTWREGGGTPKFPEDTGATLKRVWQLAFPADDADRIWCGVEPAALWSSRDDGATWELQRALWDHPHRAKWQPGGGGLCLHTILPSLSGSPMYIAVSTAGVYRTDDGGATWRTAHKGVRAEFLPDKHPEFGQCVHKVARHPSRPDRLFLQNHWGLYRSDDAGESWRDIKANAPSDFGFAMAVHPHRPETVYIVPLESDEFRCGPEGRLRVFRTDDGGGAWRALGDGLPQDDAFETVLRDGLAVDDLDPAGVYFGTRSGKLFASPDHGDHWELVSGALPPVTCVKAAVLA